MSKLRHFCRFCHFHHFRRREGGMALITAILIAALVASLAFALSARERLWLTQLGNRVDFAAAQSTVLSAIDLARLSLRDDMRNNHVDHLLEAWTVPVPPINVEDGRVGGRIVELQGRLNLYTLQSGGKVNAAGLLALQRLLSTQSLPAAWAGKMAEAMAAQVTLWLKAQKLDAAAGRITGKLLPVASQAELGELAGLTGADIDKLAMIEPLTVLLPESTAVNVNFAPPEVLMAVTPGLSLKDAESLVSRRARAHFTSAQDFVKALPEKLRASAPATLYTVESQYFLSEAEAWYGRVYVRLQALLYRQRGRMPEIVWVRRG
ncbi:MAG: type II secretion system minor pseudopilin GspK [Candidatus Accumulibacter sp.]|jgi:general secretion pathway protein K|nr:type II secretion system minor pseudopilin GspK [Accumulibacter sp.]